MTESESVALPLGDTPLTNAIITDIVIFVKCFFEIFSLFYFFFSFVSVFNIPVGRADYTKNPERSAKWEKSRQIFSKKLKMRLKLEKRCDIILYVMIFHTYFCPWHSRIARQTPTLKVASQKQFITVFGEAKPSKARSWRSSLTERRATTMRRRRTKVRILGFDNNSISARGTAG